MAGLAEGIEKEAVDARAANGSGPPWITDDPAREIS
jgi:hypothetical protein